METFGILLPTSKNSTTKRAVRAWGYQSRLEGPHSGETEWRNYGDVNLPIGRWFQMDVRLKQSKDFDGSTRVTIDSQLLADVQNVRTGYSSCKFNVWCVDQGWAATNYSNGLSPAPSTIYIDDATISRP